MISRNELLAVADATGLSANIVEKDFVLGWLLRGISQHDALRDAWIFKGGTCLKKCYFETYRFSEDLDFTLLHAEHVDDAFLRATFADISRAIYDEAGLEFSPDRMRFDIYDNPRGGRSCQGRLYYRSEFQSGNNFPAVKLDLTADELIAEAPVARPVGHPYTDEPDGGMHALCYSYEEVFAEKLRALGERARARDLYDVVHLHRNAGYAPNPQHIRELLARKCEFKRIPLITLEIIQTARDTVIGTWEGMLRHQLPELPPFAAFWDALPEIFAWLERGVISTPLAAVPLPVDAELLRPRFGGFIGLAANGSILERIRFAAQSRLLVELEYTAADGHFRSPVVEPYSLRRSRAGDVSLAAHDVAAGHIKTYRVDGIRGARVLEQPFVPRHAIELGPLSSPVTAPARASGPRGIGRQ